MELDRTQLSTLACVVGSGSFDAAAQELRVTPSAVSQRIRALEQHVGQVLVLRTRPASPTAAGRRLVRLAGQVGLLEREAAAELSRASLVVPLAVNADSLSTWFPEALAGLPPDVVVQVRRVDQDVTADLLRDGSVMAAVTSDARPVQGCSSQPLGAMRYVPVAAPGNGPSAGSPRAPADWGAGPVVAFDGYDALHTRVLHGTGVVPRAVHHVPSQDAFLTVVRAGLGWGMLPEVVARPEVAAGRLERVGGGRTLDVPLHWQRWRLRSPVLADLTERVVQAAAAVLVAPPAAIGAGVVATGTVGRPLGSPGPRRRF
jgi:LysR family transcriptional regulator (chromosome initiation inhibitor)